MAQEKSDYSVSWWSLWVIFIQIITIVVLIPSAWLSQVLDSEVEMLQNSFGKETSAYIIETGFGWYQSIFIETGINDYVHSLFVPTELERERSTGMQSLGQNTWFPWIEGRGDAVRLVLIIMFERFSQIVLWAPFLGIMFLPAAWDGFMTWKMKCYSFEYSSPWFHQFSINAIKFFFFGLVVGAFFPAPIPPTVLPLVGLFITPVIAVSMFSNLPKRV